MNLQVQLLYKGWPTADLLLLTWAAGTLDATSYLRSGAFTANMTGNTVLLGLGLFGTVPWHTLPSALALVAFGFGALLGSHLLVKPHQPGNWEHDLKRGIALELPFVAVFAVLGLVTQPYAGEAVSLVLIGTAACALGIQSVAVRRHRIAGVVTTFMTGTITTAIVSFITRRRAPDESGSGEVGSPQLLFCMWSFYFLAAASTSVLHQAHIRCITLIPLVAIALVEVRSLHF